MPIYFCHLRNRPTHNALFTILRRTRTNLCMWYGSIQILSYQLSCGNGTCELSVICHQLPAVWNRNYYNGQSVSKQWNKQIGTVTVLFGSFSSRVRPFPLSQPHIPSVHSMSPSEPSHSSGWSLNTLSYVHSRRPIPCRPRSSTSMRSSSERAARSWLSSPKRALTGLYSTGQCSSAHPRHVGQFASLRPLRLEVSGPFGRAPPRRNIGIIV